MCKGAYIAVVALRFPSGSQQLPPPPLFYVHCPRRLGTLSCFSYLAGMAADDPQPLPGDILSGLILHDIFARVSTCLRIFFAAPSTTYQHKLYSH